MRYWIIADTHFGHSSMYIKGYRPENYQHKIYKGLLQIPDEDILIHLGDFSVCNGPDNEDYHNLLKYIGCKKILVKGNHDKESNSWYMSHGWDFVCESFSDTIFGKNIVFTHEPEVWTMDYINIHGHLHEGNHRDIVIRPNNLLVSCELQCYKPQLLKNFLKNNHIL